MPEEADEKPIEIQEEVISGGDPNDVEIQEEKVEQDQKPVEIKEEKV